MEACLPLRVAFLLLGESQFGTCALTKRGCGMHCPAERNGAAAVFILVYHLATFLHRRAHLTLAVCTLAQCGICDLEHCILFVLTRRSPLSPSRYTMSTGTARLD